MQAELIKIVESNKLSPEIYTVLQKIVQSALDTNTIYTDFDSTERLLNRMLNVIDFEDKGSKIIKIYSDLRTYIRHEKLEQINDFKDRIRELLEKQDGCLPKTSAYCIGIEYLTSSNETKYILGYSNN